MANVEAEIEALRREHSEKVRQIAEKRKQVEELKRQRADRPARRTGDRRPDGPRSVDELLSEVLRGTAGDGAAEGPLRDLARERAAKSQWRTEMVSSEAVEPQENDSYEKAVQTESDQAQAPAKGDGGYIARMAERATRARAVQPDTTSMRRRFTAIDVQITPDTTVKEVEEPRAELSVEERDQIMAHPDFQSFFDRASLLVERTLGQEAWDIAADFTGGDAGGGDTDAERMKHMDDYVEKKWSQDRPVTDVRFSSRKELFLAAYGQRNNPSLSDPDGCMLVWNLSMNNRPEMAFTCQSAVHTAIFNRFDPTLFFGGTYAGGVVLWDARAQAGPVQRTPLSARGHSHPVMSMQQVGTQNATNLITASNDGRLCVWSLAMLSQPQEYIDLKHDQTRRELGVMSLSFPENETNVLYVGAEDGSVCQVHILGSKVGVTECYDGHDAPVTGIDMHPHGDASQHGVEAATDLALTSSFDWSIKLWMVKQYQSPVLSMDMFEDYVYDARWHPAHPAVFASVDGEGHVDLWNLNQDLEAPVVRCENPNQRKLALNRCHWSSDGRRLVTGDSEGRLSVYGVDRSVAQPRNEDFTQFQERVRQLQPIPSRREAWSGLDARYAASPKHLGVSFEGRF